MIMYNIQAKVVPRNLSFLDRISMFVLGFFSGKGEWEKERQEAAVKGGWSWMVPVGTVRWQLGTTWYLRLPSPFTSTLPAYRNPSFSSLSLTHTLSCYTRYNIYLLPILRSLASRESYVKIKGLIGWKINELFTSECQKKKKKNWEVWKLNL